MQTSSAHRIKAEQNGSHAPATDQQVPAEDVVQTARTDGIIGRIGASIVEGLVHGACSHYPAHPELAACLQEQQARGRTGE